MDDLPNLLQRDYGLKPQGKSAPMSTQRSTQARISGVQTVYDDVFGGPPKFTAPSFASQSQEGYDDIFRSYSTPIKNSSVPVFDAPVYDDDIFGGLKGIRNSAVPYDDVFSGGSAGGGLSSAPFEDLLGPKNSNSQRSGGNQGGSGFEDLIPGFNNSESANKTRRPCCKDQKNGGSSFEKMDFSGGAQTPEMERSKLVFFDRKKQFELEDLLRASAEMLGQASFGTAYKSVHS